MKKIHAVRIPQENARAFAYRVLATYIRELFLRPGERMSEADTAAQLSISRTPVHDTFAQLAQEKLLQVEPQRGTTVRLLEPENIRQLCWMLQSSAAAILDKLYRQRPALQKLEPLEECVGREMQALAAGHVVELPRLGGEFYRLLYCTAGYEPVFRALWRQGADLYRLLCMAENEIYWKSVVTRHMEILQALAAHDHDAAMAALKKEFDAVTLLLPAMQQRWPQYFLPEEEAEKAQ